MNMLRAIGWWFDAFTLYGGGGKGSSSPPPAPDYRGAAQEQSAASRDIATGQTFANRPGFNTPWGQLQWNTGAATDPATGTPVTQWTGNVNLTPEQQQNLESQQRIGQGRAGAAEQLLGQATGAFQTPFDWAGLPSTPGSLGEAQRGAYTTMSQMLQPGREQQQAGLETQLANMGLGRGNEAWNRELTKLKGDWAQQDKGLMAQALGEGRADVGTQQGIRQAAIAEEAQRRGMPLNELNALLSGQQVNMPSFPSFSQASAGQAPNLFGAAQAQGGYGLEAAGMNRGMQPDIGSAIGGVASVAIPALAAAGMF